MKAFGTRRPPRGHRPLERLLPLMGLFLGSHSEDVTAAAKNAAGGQEGAGRGPPPGGDGRVLLLRAQFLGQHRARGDSPGPRGLSCTSGGCSPAPGGTQPCGSLGRETTRTCFNPFTSLLLHPESQLPTRNPQTRRSLGLGLTAVSPSLPSEAGSPCRSPQLLPG